MAELNITSTAIEKGLDSIKGFLGKIMGTAVEEYGLMIADDVKLRRLKNQIANLQKAKEIAENAGINPKQINLKALVPYLEEASLEEDETLQEMWANLLVNYIDPAKNLEITVYPSILSQLSKAEVEILEICDNRNQELHTRLDDTSVFKIDPAAFANVERLGLISRLIPPEKHVGLDIIRVNSIRRSHYQLSRFGQEFLDACRR